MVTYKLKGNEKITDHEKSMIEKAKEKPIVYDEDSPELTPVMEKAFRLAAKKAQCAKKSIPHFRIKGEVK